MACELVKLACERQQRDMLRAANDPSWAYVWSDRHATDVCEFLEHLPHVEGRWATPTIRLEPWQVFIVATLYGWRRRGDLSRRRFTTAFVEVARKAAKSTLVAGLGLYHLLREQEPGASVICAAATGNQARIVFAIMQKMVRRSLWLRQQGIEALANSLVTEDGSAKPINAKSTAHKTGSTRL